MPLQYPQNTIAILPNEQPIEGCHECGILWYQLVNYRNQWRMRPTEIQKQNLFEDAQDAFLEHWHTHQTIADEYTNEWEQRASMALREMSKDE